MTREQFAAKWGVAVNVESLEPFGLQASATPRGHTDSMSAVGETKDSAISRLDAKLTELQAAPAESGHDQNVGGGGKSFYDVPPKVGEVIIFRPEENEALHSIPIEGRGMTRGKEYTIITNTDLDSYHGNVTVINDNGEASRCLMVILSGQMQNPLRKSNRKTK